MSEENKKATKLDIHAKRPISPHLGIYKLQISSGLSALHRITGFVLFSFSLLLLWWLIALVYTNFSDEVLILSEYIISKIIFWGLLTCLYFHSFNGVRHLFWDIAGIGYSIKAIDYSGWAVLIATCISSLASIFIIF